MQLRFFDFRVSACGPDIFLLPLTRAGRHWALDHLPPGERRLGRNCIVPEERIQDTLTSILLAGLTIAPLEE
jgi:hypothetical protein